MSRNWIFWAFLGVFFPYFDQKWKFQKSLGWIFRNYWDLHLIRISGQSHHFPGAVSKFCPKFENTLVFSTKVPTIWIGINKYHWFLDTCQISDQFDHILAQNRSFCPKFAWNFPMFLYIYRMVGFVKYLGVWFCSQLLICSTFFKKWAHFVGN